MGSGEFCGEISYYAGQSEYTLNCHGIVGANVKIVQDYDILTLCEVQVFGSLDPDVSPCFEYGFKIPGGDISSMNTYNVDACKNACMADDNCVAFDYKQEFGKNCFLKGDQHSKKQRSDDSISGKKECFLKSETGCSYQISNEYWELEKVEYETKAGSIADLPPEVYGEQTLENEDGSAEQKIVFTISDTVTESASYTHTVGVEVKVGTKFSCGYPYYAKGEVSTEVSTNYEFSYGTTETVSKTVSASYWCVAPARRTVTCKALLYKYSMDVPYTQTWRHKFNGQTCVSKGIFKEQAQSKMVLQVEEKGEESGGLHFRK